MTGLDLAFAATGLVTAAAAALAVTTRQVVHSALWLVVALLGLAGCYLVLGAELVALVQVLVYVGAVVVLVVVALMLTRAPIGPRTEHSTGPGHRVLAALVGAGTGALIASVLLPTAARAELRPGLLAPMGKRAVLLRLRARDFDVVRHPDGTEDAWSEELADLVELA